MLDYELLRICWWALLGVLLIGFAISDGFDLGVACLLPWVAKTDAERRILLNSVGPVWEGNQVWLILGAGAIFAAWPALYAVAFSGFYIAMLLVLAALILRPVGFKFRSKIRSKRWRRTWDAALFIGGFVPALIFGVAVGNVLQGVPFRFDSDLRAFYDGTFWQLLNPFALLCGVLSATMLIMHGAIYLSNKTVAPLQGRVRKVAIITALLTIVLFAAGGSWIREGLNGYVLANPMAHDAYSNPLHKTVVRAVGAWAKNYDTYEYFLLAPAAGFVGAFLTMVLMILRWTKTAFVTSSIALFGIIATVGVSMFPFILPSSEQPNASLMVWDASSSQLTLFIMLCVAVVFMPIILAYTAWVYRVLRGPVTVEDVNENDQAY